MRILLGLLLVVAVLSVHADLQVDPVGGLPVGPSGTEFLGPELRSLQEDPFANPGLLWVDVGERLWNQRDGSAAQSCADCHGGPDRMAGLAAGLPRWNEALDQLDNLERLIQRCWTDRQGHEALEPEGRELLALTTLLAHQSQGMPMQVRVDGPASEAFARGQASYHRRRGQLDMSCSDCHDRYRGARLRGEPVSAGMINGFPLYRLTWETLGSRQRMFRWCNDAVRAEPHPWDSDAYLELELYLAWRARGLPVETPAVRR